MTAFKVVVPARYASTRLPGKPLVELAGRAMILHVIDRACRYPSENWLQRSADLPLRGFE